MNVNIISQDKFQREIFKASKIISDSLSTHSPILINNDILIDDFIQKYIHFSDDDLEVHSRVIRPMILDAVLRSEMMAAGSGEICLNIILYMVDRTFREIKLGNSFESIEEKRKEKILKLKSEINKFSKKLHKDDVENLIEEKFELEVQKNIINELIKSSNIKSPISLNRSNKRETILSLSNGFNFNISTDNLFLPDSNVWEGSNVGVLVVDGFIESVGEIHHLLEKAAINKDPIVIFIRHMSDEVKSTISLNLKRGTINLIPVEVGFDENTLNILNDISICCDTNLISSHSGDLISSACRKDLDIVKKIKITHNKVTIVNDVNPDKIKSQVAFLTKKRDNATENLVKDIKDLFDNRIKSLSAGTIEIRIGTDLLRMDPQTVEKFDKFLRELKSLVSSGVIYSNNFSEILPPGALRKSYPYSSISVFSSLKHANAFIRDLFSIARALISEP